MKWTDLPFIVRLIAALGAVAVIVKVVSALILYLISVSVHDDPPNECDSKYEAYMRLSEQRRIFLGVFYFGVIVWIVFLLAVVNHVSNASIGHLILFGMVAASGMIGNLFGVNEQQKLKR